VGASEYPPFDLLVIVDGLALAQTGEYRMRVRAKGWIESGELDTAGNALQRIFRPVVGHDAASTLRTRNRLGPFSPPIASLWTSGRAKPILQWRRQPSQGARLAVTEDVLPGAPANQLTRGS